MAPKNVRKRLTDTFLKNHKPAKKGTRAETIDLDHRRVRFRVTERGHKSFVYLARFPGNPNPVRRWLGDYPTTSLADARAKAAEWDKLITKGVDPRDEERRVAAAAERGRRLAKENAFELKADEWLDLKHVKEQRQYGNTSRWVRKELIPVWAGTPIGEIHATDVEDVIKAIARRSPSSARNVLVAAKSLFAWACGVESPAAAVRPTPIAGKKPRRKRVLDENEVRAFWNATEQLNYPFKQLYQILLLTGVRLREASEARWSEIDLENRRWIIPAERFKSDSEHLVPLTPAAMRILRDVPRFEGGDKEDHFIFSAANGKRPVQGFGRVKDKVDGLMAAELGEVKPWVMHDLRRVVRTGLAKLRISDIVAEMVIGHGSSQLQRTYDLYQREPEMREALELWAGRVRDITTPPPANVRKLKRAS